MKEEFSMLGNIKEFIRKHWVIMIGGFFLGSIGYNQYSSLMNPPELQQFKGGVQNHLVWTIKGECYFVRPATNTVYLVRVEDCDKK